MACPLPGSPFLCFAIFISDLSLGNFANRNSFPLQSAKSTGNKVDAVWQLLSTYDAVLTHLKVHGGLVNAVKPELLLEGPGFDRVMEARNAAAAGDPAQEEALEASWSDVEARFDELSARAWNTVVLQVGFEG